MARKETLIIRDAKLLYRNFEGRKTDFNDPGDRNFSVMIDDPDVAENLMRDGWNLKPMKARDEDEEPRWHLPVKVRYDNFPPRIVMRRRNKDNIELDEIDIARLDRAEIQTCHVNINPSFWSVGNKSGVKAYLKSMIVDIEEDELMAELEDEDYGF